MNYMFIKEPLKKLKKHNKREIYLDKHQFLNTKGNSLIYGRAMFYIQFGQVGIEK